MLNERDLLVSNHPNRIAYYLDRFCPERSARSIRTALRELDSGAHRNREIVSLDLHLRPEEAERLGQGRRLRLLQQPHDAIRIRRYSVAPPYLDDE